MDGQTKAMAEYLCLARRNLAAAEQAVVAGFQTGQGDLSSLTDKLRIEEHAYGAALADYIMHIIQARFVVSYRAPEALYQHGRATVLRQPPDPLPPPISDYPHLRDAIDGMAADGDDDPVLHAMLGGYLPPPERTDNQSLPPMKSDLRNDLPPLAIVDDRTPEQLKADGDTHWPGGKPYTPPPAMPREDQ